MKTKLTLLMSIALKCKKAPYIASAARNDGWTQQYMYISTYNKLHSFIVKLFISCNFRFSRAHCIYKNGGSIWYRNGWFFYLFGYTLVT
jgi:hypothetical protein